MSILGRIVDDLLVRDLDPERVLIDAVGCVVLAAGLAAFCLLLWLGFGS